MRVVVTGAGGFIGKTLTPHLLDRGYEVIAMVHRSTDISFYHENLTWRVGDITDAAFVRSCVSGAHYVVHLAARKSDEPSSYATNVEGAKNLIEAAETYGISGIVNITTLSTKFLKAGIYGTTKKEADTLFQESRIPSITLSLSVVYGDGESGVFGTLLRYIKLPFVPVIGSGTPTYRPVYVGDVAVAIEKILAAGIPATRAYELGGPDLISFNALARLLGHRIEKKNIILVHIPIPAARAIAYVFSLFLKHPPITTSNVLGAGQYADIYPDAFYASYRFAPMSLEEGVGKIIEAKNYTSSEPFLIMRYVSPHASAYSIDLYEQTLKKYSLTTNTSPRLLKSNLRIGGFDAITRILRPEGVFQRKLLAAATIVECSPQSVSLLPRSRSVPKLLYELCIYTLQSLCILICGLIIICIPHLYADNA